MIRLDFATATRIVFETGAIAQLPAITKEFGTKALVVTGRNASRFSHILDGLRSAVVDVVTFRIPGEPTVDQVREGTRIALASERYVVIGIGGGSAIDAAKAIAILAENSGEPLDYLEVIGKGERLTNPPLPFIAVPTTAGTGAEVTRNAVLGSPAHELKASLRSPMMLAKVALVDPDLTLAVPPDVTAHTGLDALTQLIEPFVSRNSNPFIDLFCCEGMRRVSACLVRAFDHPGDRPARRSMSYASMLSGLALSNAGLGVVHGIAGPLGGMIPAPHGAICAALLPEGVHTNVHILRRRERAHPALQKYAEAARLLTGDPEAEPDDLAPWLADLVERLQVSKLSALGLTRERVPELVQKATRASSMKANPIKLTDQELTDLVERAL